MIKRFKEVNAYVDGFYYFLQADYGQGKVALYKYLPEEALEAVAEFGTDEVDLYNLQIPNRDAPGER